MEEETIQDKINALQQMKKEIKELYVRCKHCSDENEYYELSMQIVELEEVSECLEEEIAETK